MGAKTEIGWTDATWNPWHGCHKVSAGCKNCYMFSDKARYGQDPNKVVRSKTTFQEPLKWKEGRRIFTCSWSDWFIEEADEWRDEAYDVIRATPWHTYQVLTKRIERATGRMPDPPLPNLWLGTSVEDQATANVRIPLLLRTSAAIRFVSYEPALGPVSFKFMRVKCLRCPSMPEFYSDNPMGSFRSGSPCKDDARRSVWCAACGWMYDEISLLNWMIVGGESGPNARQFDVRWARSVRDQCAAAGVPCFVKQYGAKPWDGGDGDLTPSAGNLIFLKDRKGADPSEWPEPFPQEFPR